MFDDYCPDQNPGVQRRPSSGFGRITFVEQTDQCVPRDLGAEHHPTVGGIQLVVERGFKSGKGKLVLAGVFAAWCTPFGGFLHSPLRFYLIKFKKVVKSK